MRCGFDVNGTHDVTFVDARKTAKIFTLAETFLAKEDTQAAELRTVYTDDIRALVAQSGAALDLKSSGESQRVQSSEEVKALDEQSVELVQKIHRMLVYEFGDTPAKAVEWGFDIKQTGKRSGTILVPAGRAAIVAVLDRYAKTEQARPAAEQFTSPALAEVIAVVEGLKQNLGARGTGKSQRASGTQQTLDAAANLLDLLQAAAIQIVVKQFDGKITPGLAEWGFEVTAKSRPAKKAVEAAPVEGEG